MTPFEVLGLADGASADDVKARWRDLRSEHHPDHGGDADEFHRLRMAYDDALRQAQAPIQCPGCYGSGKKKVQRGISIIQFDCSMCNGMGVVERETT